MSDTSLLEGGRKGRTCSRFARLPSGLLPRRSELRVKLDEWAELREMEEKEEERRRMRGAGRG